MNCSMPGFPVLYYLLELAQTHVYWVSDAIQPSHPVTPFSSCSQSFPASGCFWVSWLLASWGQSIGASATASVLPMSIQDWFPSGLTLSPCSPRDSQESSPTPQLKSINSLVLNFFYSPTLTSIYLWLDGLLLAKQRLCFLIYCLGWSSWLFFQGASIF